jgi:nucleoside-diphosphate-sugar epimerase
MKLLVLGGTLFVGRAIVDSALRSGWHVTTFNRGKSGTDLPHVQAIHGDRTRQGDLSRLLDYGPGTSSLTPPATSTVSVYADWLANEAAERIFRRPLLPARRGT